MATIQTIDLNGRLAALAVAGAAIIHEHVPDELVAHVQAKALYALQIQAGERPGPYTDAGAERYARRAAAAAAIVTPHGDRPNAPTDSRPCHAATCLT